MPTVHIEANLSTGELLEAVDALNPAELDQFVAEVLALRARRRAPSLPPDEAELLLRINQGLPDAVRARYEELHARQDAGTLEPEEHEELLRIITGMEDLQAQRAEDLARLAQLRGVTLSGLLDSLGIQAPVGEFTPGAMVPTPGGLGAHRRSRATRETRPLSPER